MIQQRPNESDEDYNKRKRRVKLSMMGTLANGGGYISEVLASIIYNMDTFNVDTLLRTIDNAGSGDDAPMYGSNHIDLQATMSVSYRTVSGSDYIYFDVTTKAHISGTAGASTVTLSSPTHHSNFCSLKGGATVSAGDLTALDANPEDLARIVDSKATVGTYSFVLADIEAFYPGNEGLPAGANIYDVTDGTWATFSVITNYTSTCRTNLDLANYGASNLLYKQDATGRFIGMADTNLIEFTGDSRYADTIIPSVSKDFTLEAVFTHTNTGSFELNGSYGATNTRFSYGSSSTLNAVSLHFGDYAIETSASVNVGGLNHLVTTFNSATSEIKHYLNSTLVASNTIVLVQPTDSLYIGGRNRSGVIEHLATAPHGILFLTEDTLMSQIEVDTAYALAKAMYPTLP